MQHDLIESPLILVDDPLYGHERNQRYKLVDRISDGGNIIAFVARYIDLDDAGKLVAIKFIKIQQADQPLSKFIEYELTSHRRLHHPHIIELKEVFLTEEYIAVVMEYAAGGDLFSLARELGKLTEDKARCFFQQLISALHYCHRMGVLVRDIKLENCLLQGVPEVTSLPLLKIYEFGPSKGNMNVSDPKSIIGTLAYKAPEVAASTPTSKYDHQLADLWSAGVMLYVMLFDTYPFETLNTSKPRALKIIKSIMEGSWRIPEGVSISPACEQLLHRLLVVKPEERMTMGELMKNEWYLTNLQPETQKIKEELFLESLATNPSDDPGYQQIKELMKEAIDKQNSFLEARQSREVPEEIVVLMS